MTGIESVIRHRLGVRLLLVLCGIAGFSTAVALVLQDRTLANDLEAAARDRLERAAYSADRLLEAHVSAVSARYHAIAGTPQFRANLEVNDPPTLAHYAREIAEKQGAARILFLDETDAEVAVAGDVDIDEQARNAGVSSLAVHHGRPYAVVSVALASAGRTVGRLVAAEPIGDATIEGWSELCGAEVSFAPVGEVPADGVSALVRDFDGLEMRVAATLEAEHRALTHSRSSLLLAGGLALLAAFVASVFVTRGAIRPILELRTAAERIGRGDLTVAVASNRQDEIGDVARAFAAMVDALRGMVGSVSDAVGRVEATAAQTAEVSESVATSTAGQAREIDRATESMNDVNREVSVIAQSAQESADVLDASIEGSSLSMRQLVATGSELRENSSLLGVRVGETGRAIESMVASARRAAEATESLAAAAAQTSESMDEMASSTLTVRENARKTAELTNVVADSSEKGRERVRETIAGMQAIHDTTQTAQRVVHDLGDRVKQIGTIATVIDRVAEETHLLALNASIIAAQSGERGRAFAVVADQMKALARHVSTNTEEINGVVQAIQEQAENAISAIEAGSARVDAGVDLASQAGTSLEEITRAAKESGTRTLEIVAAMEEQAKSAEYVADLMRRVSEGVSEIRAAGDDQSRGHDAILVGAAAMEEAARQVRTATEMQTTGTEQIGRDIEVVHETVGRIKQALLQQSDTCLRAARFLEMAREHTGGNAEAAAQVGEATQTLRTQAERLRAEIHRFQISGDVG